MKAARVNYVLAAVVLAAAALCFAIGWQRVVIDTDVVRSMPHDDPVIGDAMDVLLHHPLQDQLTLDVSLSHGGPDLLVACGRRAADLLGESGLFKTVGIEDLQAVLPQLVEHVVERLPVLFTAGELNGQILPLISPERVQARIAAWREQMLQLSGIGQAGTMARDPLGLKDLLLARLINLAPSQQARIYKGQLMSADGRHLLLTAAPRQSSTDTAVARRLGALVAQTEARLQEEFAGRGGGRVTLTAVGAYRAALDNEAIMRTDVNRAVLFATLGIALLLILSFPRPLIGLLSLLPALAGTVGAFFLWTLVHPSMSIMVLGFGGAIISITVDYGIAYLLFMDSPDPASGHSASREVWGVGLLAALTTVGGFAALLVSDFPIFQQLGMFSAMGIGLSFLFVHTVFPRILPQLPPAPQRRLPLRRLADRLFGLGPKAAWAALAFAVVMTFFAKPAFDTDPSAMNTVSRESQEAEQRLTAVWGDIFGKVFLMTEARSPEELQDAGDRLLARLESDPRPGALAQAFLPSMLFPGKQRRAANLAAWRGFWQPPRVAALRAELREAALANGLRAEAFEPFLALLSDPASHLPPDGPPPEAFYRLMGIAAGSAAAGGTWRQFATLSVPADYPPAAFYERYGKAAKVFDPPLFSARLGRLMFSTFSRLVGIVAAAVALLLLVFFLDLRLTLICLAPALFAMIATLSTLNLMGRGLDIPSLMLGIIILGMGIDYSLFVVRSYQRYGRADHPSFSLIRSSVLMSASSTMIGFGVLSLSQHALLKSAGITSLLGIGYSLMGAFLILPPLLEHEFRPKTAPAAARGGGLDARVRARYRRMEPYPRLFARFKLRLDPMFAQMEKLVHFDAPPAALIDIGSGYGVPACWLAERFPQACIHGIEPDPERVRVAARALSGRGAVVCGRAPELPPAPPGADGAFLLDMIHFLSDEELSTALVRLAQALRGGGRLWLRAVMVPTRRLPWCWWLDRIRLRLGGLETNYRPAGRIEALLRQAGFIVETRAPSGSYGELLWFCCTVRIQKPDPSGEEGEPL